MLGMCISQGLWNLFACASFCLYQGKPLIPVQSFVCNVLHHNLCFVYFLTLSVAHFSPLVPFSVAGGIKYVSPNKATASTTRDVTVQRHSAHLLWLTKDAAPTSAPHASSGIDFSYAKTMATCAHQPCPHCCSRLSLTCQQRAKQREERLLSSGASTFLPNVKNAADMQSILICCKAAVVFTWNIGSYQLRSTRLGNATLPIMHRNLPGRFHWVVSPAPHLQGSRLQPAAPAAQRAARGSQQGATYFSGPEPADLQPPPETRGSRHDTRCSLFPPPRSTVAGRKVPRLSEALWPHRASIHRADPRRIAARGLLYNLPGWLRLPWLGQ